MNPQSLLLTLFCLVGYCCAATKFVVSPEVLESSYDTLTISWSGLAEPTKYDVICIYTPAESEVTQPIGWFNLNQVHGWSNGMGQIQVPLVNPHSDYVFRLWNYNTPTLLHHHFDGIRFTNYSLVSTSSVVTFSNPDEPLQGRLALTSNQDEMRVMWVTAPSKTVPSTPMVFYGLSSDSLNLNATGVSYTYNATNMCSGPNETATNPVAYRDPGWIHDVVLSNLQPSTVYYYQFGSKDSGLSPVYYFVASPDVGPESEINVVAYGDLGYAWPFETLIEQQPSSILTAKWVEKLLSQPLSNYPFSKYSKLSSQPDAQNTPPNWMVLHIGDISYARGWAFIWEWFSNLIQPIATQAPYMVSMGNHEYDYYAQAFRPQWTDYGNDSGGECGIPYSYRFHMPDNSEFTGFANPNTQPTFLRNLFYSFDMGPAHFTVLNVETNFTIGSEQYKFVLEDWNNVDRDVTPWLIMSVHRPFYTSSDAGIETIMYQHMREVYEPLLMKYQVDMCLYGHVHVYERTCQMYNYTCIEEQGKTGFAPVHLVIGMAGNDYQSSWVSNDEDDGNGHFPQPKWSMFRTNNFGYTRFFANSTDLFFEYVGDQLGLVHDSFHLQRS
eukprot:TRINITY_DN832_c0_g2_i2.p1 TRINITY_DN832_c0_g2~~TRINITY_DN832_c0_g2_i2.p1  ORF type:complete len:608 (-),score=96.49 TRINITY_DN832_c0_g2_i2:68-1891(-)